MAALKPTSVKNFPQAVFFQSVSAIDPVVGPGEPVVVPAVEPAVEPAELPEPPEAEE